MQGLQLKENDKAEIVIYSSMGQLVLKTEYNKTMQATDVTNIDISLLNSGSYMYKVMLNGVVMQLDKLIILK
jgi:type IX secretion system substrate protein